MADTKRLVLPDLIKGIAIFLVVFGHSIQYASGAHFLKTDSYYMDFVFKVIYSFHMPLFSLISGFLFSRYTNKPFSDTFYTKFNSLIIPVFFWSPFLILGLTLFHPSDFLTLFFYWHSNIFNYFWFIWGIFYLSIIVAGVNFLFKNEKIKIVLYLFLFFITLVTPDTGNIDKYKFIYPYFIIGFYTPLFLKRLQSFYNRHYKFYLASVSILFSFLLIHYTYQSYIYISGYDIFNPKTSPVVQLYTDIFRFTIGLVGSLWTILLLNFFHRFQKHIYRPIYSFFLLLGQNTLGIYIISSYLNYNFPINLISSPSYLLNLGVTFVILGLCLLIIYLIKKSKIANTLFLGGRM